MTMCAAALRCKGKGSGSALRFQISGIDSVQILWELSEMSIFQEIAFAAELNRHEDPEAKDAAWQLCGEDHITRKQNIEELRNMIYERGECYPHRLDDAYMLRFLRARGSIPARAHRLLVRYWNFREQNPYLYRGINWFSLSKLGNMLEGVLYDRPDVGRLLILRLGEWDPDETPAEDLLRGVLLMLEIGIMQPKLQILGGMAVVDCEGLTMGHMKNLSPTFARHAINIMGYAFPGSTRKFHIVNCSRVFELMFHIFKKIAPADDIWKRVQFHGYDLSSLHREIDPECLPKRYGGHRQEVSFKLWLTKIRQYKNQEFDQEMLRLGYALPDD
ncbi:CRAL/TRIO domain-containing protein [Phthorimaea operculella]|nr:CRAL/TRIO domain-containing protein [Phthorimaea operculella]